MIHGPVLVTGISGFLGYHIAQCLTARGRAVRGLVRATSDTRHLASLPDVTLVEGDLDDPASLANATRGVGGVIHAAALVKARTARDFERVNLAGTNNLLEAARGAGPGLARFVHVSSLAALGPSEDGRPRPSGTPPAPLTWYGRSKLEAERRVVAASGDLHTVVIRPSVVHGPRDRGTLSLYRAVKLGILPLTGSPASVVSTVYASDCADACVRALDAPVASGSAFDLEDGAPQSLKVIVGHIEAAMGTRVRIRVPIPGPVLMAAAVATQLSGWVTRRTVMLTMDKVKELRAPHWVCDATPARSALGWRPVVTFEEGARRAAAWYREAAWL